MADVAMPVGNLTGTQEGEGSLVGWYIGVQDGLPRRLPVEPRVRDRYTRGLGGRGQRMRWIEEAGIYDLAGTVERVPGTTNSVRNVPLQSKYEQLRDLAETIPELREAFVKQMAGTRSARPQVFACACGLEFTNADVFSIHQEGCPTAATGAASLAASSQAATATAPAGESAAPVAKPPRPVTCKTCGDKFDSLPEHNRHKRAEHGRSKKAVAA